MKTLRWILPALALALITPGCILTSGQITIDFSLGDITVASNNSVDREIVNLNSIGDYADHKSDLQGLADVAALGTFVNTGQDVGVEFWMTSDTLTTYTTEADVRLNGTKLWGLFKVASGDSTTVDWDTSAGLFDPTGKDKLITEVKGDGIFTIYAIGKVTVGAYSFRVDKGSLVLVLDAAI